jgi:glycosyltransferase involved in cell wall biosynthesis
VVRILVFHGYLLEGTGSNIYNASLAEALANLGHEVHLLSQERHAAEQPFVDAIGEWERGRLHVRRVRAARSRSRGSCTVYRPDIGALLPVYVADRYEGIEARTFAQCSDEEIERYLNANIAAVRDVSELVAPQLALANHLVMGPVILARALAGEVAYAVKIHGSALEYTVKPSPERFLPYAREGLAGARAVLVGSRHTAESLWDAIGDEQLRARTRLGPPGVDVARFAPEEPAQAVAGVRALTATLSAQSGGARSDAGARGAGGAAGAAGETSSFARDAGEASRALARLHPEADDLVAFAGKLIVSKGIDLLLAAWPLVLARAPRAQLVVVGFGAFREGLEQLCAALAAGDVERAAELARAGRALEAHAPSQARPLHHLLAFLDGLQGDAREAYLTAARRLPERFVLTGRLEHEELAQLLPACRALVVPSTFPESFGMVAAEAAACGVLPIAAAHSGLREVSEVLAAAVPAEVAPWLSFPLGDGVIDALAERVTAWLEAGPELRERARAALVSAARAHWSWEGVARGVIAAASGELEGLSEP